MKDRFKGCWIPAALGLMLLFCVSFAGAAPGWSEGEVTKSGWRERFSQIEIDEELFTVMPDALVLRRIDRGGGRFDEKNISISQVTRGARVTILHEGTRIFQLVVIR